MKWSNQVPPRRFGGPIVPSGLAVSDFGGLQKVIRQGVPQVLSVFRKMMKDNDGATAIEYTLIAALISVAAITAMSSVGGKVSNVLGNVANAMT